MLGTTAIRNARHALGVDKLRGAFSLCDAFDDLTARTSRTTTTTAAGQTGEQTGEQTGQRTASPLFTLLHGERVAGPMSIERKPMFAVVELAGTQYKVTPDDLIITEKLSGVDVNDRIRLNKVLLLGNKTETVIGRPAVEGASVVALVEEQFLDGKVLVFKKRRRKNSRRLNGHRQPLTSLRVIDIEGPFSTTCW